MLEDGLVTLIGADSAVTAIIADRLYPVSGPPDNPVYPYTIFRNLPLGGSDYTLDGAESRRKTIQFEIFSPVYSDGRQMFKALRNLLSGYVGTLGEGTRILYSLTGAEEDNFDSNQKVYRSICDYEFTCVEP